MRVSNGGHLRKNSSMIVVLCSNVVIYDKFNINGRVSIKIKGASTLCDNYQ